MDPGDGQDASPSKGAEAQVPRVSLTPKETDSPLKGVLAPLVMCLGLMGLFYALTRPDPPPPVEPVSASTKGDDIPTAPETPPAPPPAAVSTDLKRWKFPLAGLSLEFPSAFKVSRSKQSLFVQLVFERAGNPDAVVLTGPAFPWMTLDSVKARLQGTWHDGGEVDTRGVRFSSPAVSWRELDNGFVLFASDRLVMVSTRAKALQRQDVQRLLSSIQFLPLDPVRARYQRKAGLTDAQANAPAPVELTRKMDADLKTLEAITLPLPLPMSTGIDAYKAGGMNTLDLLILRGVVKPAIDAAAAHAPRSD